MTIRAVGSTFFYFCSCISLIFCDDKPINFPPSIPVKIGNFHNWVNELFVPNLWIAIPATEDDVVTLANWAVHNKYKLRASGFMHNWSPLTVTAHTDNANVILVNTTVYLKSIQVPRQISSTQYAVRVQTGASMIQLLQFLENHGLGLYATPAIGDLTVGGVLSVGAHGTGVPYIGEVMPPDGHQAYGTISNLIVALKAVVWDTTSNKFILKTFRRCDIEAKAFLVTFGRTFITEVTLKIGSNYNLRCVSSFVLTTDQLFSRSSQESHTFSHLLNQSGRVEITIFPFTQRPWLKVWTATKEKPALSTLVTSPYNYPITDNIPDNVIPLLRRITEGNSIVASKLGEIALAVVEQNLLDTMSHDIWGLSKNVLLYVKSSTLRLAESGYAVMASRSNIQKVLNAFNNFYRKLIDSYKTRGKYPINGPVVIRATSLDTAEDDIFDVPSFSAIHPIPGHHEYDTVIWINVLTVPNSPLSFEAMSELESFMWNEYDGTYAHVRPEWSKGWAYTNESGWNNGNIYRNFIPATFGIDQWNWAVTLLDKYDPHRIFTNAFLDAFLKTVD